MNREVTEWKYIFTKMDEAYCLIKGNKYNFLKYVSSSLLQSITVLDPIRRSYSMIITQNIDSRCSDYLYLWFAWYHCVNAFFVFVTENIWECVIVKIIYEECIGMKYNDRPIHYFLAILMELHFLTKKSRVQCKLLSLRVIEQWAAWVNRCFIYICKIMSMQHLFSQFLSNVSNQYWRFLTIFIDALVEAFHLAACGLVKCGWQGHNRLHFLHADSTNELLLLPKGKVVMNFYTLFFVEYLLLSILVWKSMVNNQCIIAWHCQYVC